MTFDLFILVDDGSIVHVQAAGSLSQVSIQHDGNPLEQLLGPGGFARTVLLNLERVEFLDSSGISWLIVCHKAFVQHGGAFVLHSVPPRILQVLQFCSMDRLFKIASDEAAARALVRGGTSS
jgi:anti-anti-sigma factor